jgi:hypothetical protein
VFETERLVVREVAAGDLEAILAVYLSNPDYLEVTEGSAGEAGSTCAGAGSPSCAKV